MDKFWLWLKEKYFSESIILEGVYNGTGEVPIQMLIGYMIEYLNEINLSYNLFSSSIDYCYIYLTGLIESYNDLIEKDKKKKNL